MTTDALPVITAEPKFYGYIIALGLQDNTGYEEGERQPFYVMFEYNHASQVFIVPDAELFAMLALHLVDMAKCRDIHHTYGLEKLWISKPHKKWVVVLS